jgi:predicted nuclease of restriction endonuclease-like (RecB) superfamily
LPPDYTQVLAKLKRRVAATQRKAALSVNRELIALYLDIGGALAARTAAAGWGDKVVERLAADLRAAFPTMSGFSRTNLFHMRQVHEAWADADRSLKPLVARVPWGHHLVLLAKVREPATRAFYLRATVAHGWSRAVLTAQIESQLHRRQGRALTNFQRVLPSPQSDLAQQTLKDPYLFDFLTIAADARERELEAGLVEHVQKFLLELGVGFAFVGRQVHLEVDGRDFYLDLLFYHLKLRCYVVIELKAGAFEPEFAGKMNFYLSAVDAQHKHADDQPSIGLLLCKSKSGLIVEYALRDLKKPIGVAQWETQLTESLPRRLRGSLPSVEELESELDRRR